MWNLLAKIGLFVLVRDLVLDGFGWLKKHWLETAPGLILAFLCFYLHGEYLHWVEISGDKTFLTLSFVIKNTILVVLVCIYIYMPVRRFTKIENKEQALMAEHRSNHTPVLERSDVFEKIRIKEKLLTKTDQILSNKDREEDHSN